MFRKIDRGLDDFAVVVVIGNVVEVESEIVVVSDDVDVEMLLVDEVTVVGVTVEIIEGTESSFSPQTSAGSSRNFLFSTSKMKRISARRSFDSEMKKV